MNIILEECLDEVYIGGLKYKIKSDFKTSMKFEILMSDKNISNEMKLEIALEMYFGDQFIIDVEQGILTILDFYIGDKKLKSSNKKEKQDPIYSFLEDDELIFASFIQAYNIDLTTSNMHWWKFKALFFNLPENTIMAKVMGYRAIEIKSSMTKEEQSFYRKMKRLYSLENNKTVQEKEEDFANALWG